LGTPRDNIKMGRKEIGYEMQDWMHLGKDRLRSSNKTFRNEGKGKAIPLKGLDRP
jgi:hypothetical protein